MLDKIKEDIQRVKVVEFHEEEIFNEAKFVSLKKGNYLLNNGENIYREVVSKKIGTGNAVCVFAVTTDKKILLVVQPRTSLPDSEKVNIELPAGYVEPTEEIVTAGIRELLEETGYTSEEVFVIDEYYPSLGFSGEKITLLLALNCIKIGSQMLDPGEVLRYELVSLEEFEYLLNHGYLKDSNTRIGYYRYLEYLMKEGY